MPTFGKSYASVSVIPTSAGTTALIGDPGPKRSYRQVPALRPADLELGPIDWSVLARTDRAKAARAIRALTRAMPALADAWRRFARNFAQVAEALGPMLARGGYVGR